MARGRSSEAGKVDRIEDEDCIALRVLSNNFSIQEVQPLASQAQKATKGLEIVELMDRIVENERQISENEASIQGTLEEVYEVAARTFHPLSLSIPSILKGPNLVQKSLIRNYLAPFLDDRKQVAPDSIFTTESEEAKLHNQAVAFYEKNQFVEALLILNTILRKFPYALADRLLRAEILLHQEKFDLALKDANVVLTIDPFHFFALSLQGEIYLRQKKLLKAKKSFEGLIKSKLYHPSLIMRRCYFYLRTCDLERAREDLKAVKEFLKNKKENLTIGICTHLFMAEIFFLFEQKDFAHACIKYALQFDPENTKARKLQTFMAEENLEQQLLEQIMDAYMNGKYELVIKLIELAKAKLNESSLTISQKTSNIFLLMKATILSLTDQRERALENARQCLDSIPFSPTALSLNGELLLRLNLMEAATRCFHSIKIKYLDQYLNIRLRCCLFYFHSKQFDRLEKELQLAEEKNVAFPRFSLILTPCRNIFFAK